MKLVNIDYIPGEEITEALGIVKGQVVQSKNIGRDFMAGMKTIVGGEIVGYTEMLKTARNKRARLVLFCSDTQKLQALAIKSVEG